MKTFRRRDRAFIAAAGLVGAVGFAVVGIAWPTRTALVGAVVYVALGSFLLGATLSQSDSHRSEGPREASRPNLPVIAVALLTLSAALVAVDRLGLGLTDQRPEWDIGAGRLVYRVYDGSEDSEFGRSWTPIDPRSLGPDLFRVVAGLPDVLNPGTHLVFGLLDSIAGIAEIKPADPVFSGNGAHCSYPGGLIEFVIADARRHVDVVATVPLDPDYGGPPSGSVPCEDRIDPAPSGE